MAELQKKDVLPIKKAIKNICKEEDFFYSDVIDYIKGDVSSKMHLTLFYGLIDKEINKNKLNENIRKIKLNNLELGKVFFISGYKNQYKLLCLKVLDKNKELKKVHDTFKKFPYEINVQHKNFKPHLTLAYLKPNFRLNHKINFPTEIKIRKITYDI
ncbi:MAG: hypothetical protein PHO02_04700 [Candidatus Nanoarchaeia archaeon]|nr:hypothetical protein [Candidatus Nanoarchaeia archaeon]